MTLVEFIAVLVFLAVFSAVYLREIFLLFYICISRLGKLSLPSGLCNKWAVFNHILAFTGLICILYGYFIESYWIDVKNVPVLTEKFSSSSIRVVQITDTHCVSRMQNERRIIEIVNGLDPDIIVFTGDSANDIKALPLFRETLGRLNARIGKFAVTGNEDTRRFAGVDLFAGTGFQLFNAGSIRLSKGGEDFFISGVSDGFYGQWNKALENITEGQYNIFLCHKPDLIGDLKEANIDLYLCGHTHGGQVALPFYGALITFSKYGKKYESGRYQVGGVTLYTNRGLGTEGFGIMRVRFFSRPEITVFDIKPL